jgi:hypothetical protein
VTSRDGEAQRQYGREEHRSEGVADTEIDGDGGGCHSQTDYRLDPPCPQGGGSNQEQGVPKDIQRPGEGLPSAGERGADHGE